MKYRSKIFFSILISICSNLVIGQNLILNGDFETVISCPTNWGQMNKADFWRGLKKHLGTADYFHYCATNGRIRPPTTYMGNLKPFSGSGFAGIALVSWAKLPNQMDTSVIREYLSGQLSGPLIKDKIYLVSLKYSTSERSRIIPDELGVHFSLTETEGNTNFSRLVVAEYLKSPINPGKFENWQSIQWLYKSKGGEEHITIGNFIDDSLINPKFPVSKSVSYIFLDNVSVLPCNDINLTLPRDTFLCQGKELVLEKNSNNQSYQWQGLMKGQKLVVRESGSYIALISNYCFTVLDTVEVFFDDCPSFLELPNFFSPNGDKKNDTFGPLIHENISDYNLQVFNRWGNQVFKTTNLEEKWEGTSLGEKCANGVYYWVIKYSDFQGNNFTKKGSLTLIGQ